MLFQWVVLPLNMLMIVRFVILIMVVGASGHMEYFWKTGAEADEVMEKIEGSNRYVERWMKG